MIAIHQGLVAETLGEADGVALIDESGVVKQGDDSVGVAAQYCGSLGKVANSQVGVYLGYASRKGYSLIEGQLFIPESWFDEEHTDKRVACGIPAELQPQTKPKIGLELLRRAIQRGSLPFAWVAADELYGDSPAFRDGVAELDKWYFTEIKSTTPIWRCRPEVYVPEWKGRGRHPTRLRLRYPEDRPIHVRELVGSIPKESWSTATIKEGSKGPIVCDFAFLRITESRGNLPGPAVWLIIRRNLDDPTQVKFYFSNAPLDTPLIEFVRISIMRWPIEFNFRDAKKFWGLEDLMNVTPTAVTNAANLALFMTDVSQVLMCQYRQDDPNFSILDMKAYYRGYRYVTETIQMLPQKPDDNLVFQLFHNVAALGRIHPVKGPVPSG